MFTNNVQNWFTYRPKVIVYMRQLAIITPYAHLGSQHELFSFYFVWKNLIFQVNFRKPYGALNLRVHPQTTCNRSSNFRLSCSQDYISNHNGNKPIILPSTKESLWVWFVNTVVTRAVFFAPPSKSSRSGYVVCG